MAQQRVLRDPAIERRLERVDVVDALSGVGSLAEQVLVHVRDGGRVGIHAAGSRERPLVKRALAAHREPGCYPWLQDGVAARDTLLGCVETRPVQRVRHLADQPQHRVARQPRVGIERDDPAHAGRHGRVDECRVGSAAQQPVQLVQLAALALPPHPDALAGVEHPAAVQQQEPGPARAGAVAAVQGLDLCGRKGEQRRIPVHHLLVRVKAVKEQGEDQFAFRAGEVMDLQPLDMLQQVGTAA